METILVVDDDRAMRDFVREVLKSAGYAVEAASDGVEALSKLKKKKFDLILLDIRMPKKDGLEVLAELRHEPQAPPAIVSTSTGVVSG